MTAPVSITPSPGAAGLRPSTRAAAILPLRLVAFGVVQAAIAATYAAAGNPEPWASSVPWWPVVATVVNIATVAIVASLMHREGLRYRDLFRIERAHIRRDLATVAALAIIVSVVVILPNFLLASWLFGDPETPLQAMVQPLPLWASWIALVAFPITIALSELPAYFAYAQPRLATRMGRPFAAIALTAGFLALQHATLPLVPAWDFVLWRTLMFLPLALVLAVVLRRRPRLLPYLVVLHGLADLQIAAMIFNAGG